MACLSQERPGTPETQVMGEEFQFLRCQRCQKQPRSPRLLPCLHTLCTDCLQEIKPIGQCPICWTPIPHASGMPGQDNLLFASLQAKLNTYQSIVSGSDLVCGNCGAEGEFWCSECEEFLCFKCFEAHQRYLKRSHEAQAVRDLKVASAREFLGCSRKPSSLSCPNPAHVNQSLSIYCRECQKPICCICALLDSRHSGKHCDIKVEIQQRQQELGSMSEELKKKEELFTDAYSNLKSKADHLDQVGNETKELIQKRVEHIVQLIHKKEQELLDMVERQHRQRNEELEGKLQQTEAMLKRLGAAEQLVEKMHLYASDQEVMDMHPIIKGSLEELRKLQPLAVGTSVQIGDFSECKASLQALFERVTRERGTATPQRAAPAEESAAMLRLSLEPLPPPEASHLQTHLPAPDRAGLFSWEDPAYPPCAQAEHHPAKDGEDVQPANRGGGSPALLASPPAQAQRNGEKPTSGQLASTEGEMPTGQEGKQAPLPSEQGGLAAQPRVRVSQADSLLGEGSSILKGQHTLTSALIPFLQEAISWWQAMQQPASAPPSPGSPPLPEMVPSLPSDLLDLFPSEGSVSLLPAAPIARDSSSHSASPPPPASSPSPEPTAHPRPVGSSKGRGEAGAGAGPSMDNGRGKRCKSRSQGQSTAASKKKKQQH